MEAIFFYNTIKGQLRFNERYAWMTIIAFIYSAKFQVVFRF